MWPTLATLVLTVSGFVGGSPSGMPDPAGMSPGDSLGLEPPPVVSSGAGTEGESPIGLRLPAGFAGPSSALIGGAVAVGVARRKRDDDPIVVVVHGNGGAGTDFDGLLRAMDISRDQVIAFDWRTSGAGSTSTEASRSSDTSVASRELEFLLRDLSTDHSNIYTLHHSKGGAVGADLIRRLDSGIRPPIDGYRGAALLDPAIASGPLGFIQRVGQLVPFIPDNGGFDPILCDDGGCHDSLANLGDVSGIEVVAIRNPDAVLTNFTGKPKGLRVFDLVDDGKPTAHSFWFLPPLAWARVFEAHSSVLHSPIVASCLKAEIEQAKSCVWNGSWTPHIGWRGTGGGRPKAF